MPTIPRRSDNELRQEADDFLARYNPEFAIPVPIERIIEKDLGLDIVPFRAYKQRFGLDGSISTDLTTITVDEDCMLAYPNRYRFTLAHEVAHLVLHREYIKSLAADDTEDWKKMILDTNSTDHGRMEYQAYFFAGCVLVPRAPLLTAFGDAKQLLEQRGFDIAELSDVATSTMAGWIAKQFDVSTQVVDKRLKKEGLVA